MKYYLNISKKNGLHIGGKPTKHSMLLNPPEGMARWEIMFKMWERLKDDGIIKWVNIAPEDKEEEYQWRLTAKGERAMGF